MRVKISTDYLLPDPKPRDGNGHQRRYNTENKEGRRQYAEIRLMEEALATGQTFTEFEWDRHCILNAGCFCSADSYQRRRKG